MITHIRVYPAILLLPFLLAGLVMFGLAIRNIYRGVTSTQWPPVVGEVTHTRELPVGSTGYVPVVHFQYAIDGNKHSASEQIHYWTRPYLEVKKVTQSYPVGKALNVYVNPRDPTDSTLFPGLKGRTFALLGVGLLLTTLIAVMMYSIKPPNESG